MSETVPTFAGWYPDDKTGGTKYWDGVRWSGDVRPARRPFAARASHRGWGIILAVFGAVGIIGSPTQFVDKSSLGVGFADFISTLIIGIACAVGAVYLLRGQGPTTKAVRERLAQETLARGRAAAGASGLDEEVIYHPNGDVTALSNDAGSSSDVEVAQIEAISNPDTAQALQNLQNLLYTRTISQAEYQAAKDKILGDQ